MKKKKFFVLAGFILLLGIVGCVLALQQPDTSLVEIAQGDDVLYQLDLEQEDNKIIEVEYEGRINRIEISEHRIHMLEAECPDHTCVRMGWLDSAAPIICLPNHLTIRFVDSDELIDVQI